MSKNLKRLTSGVVSLAVLALAIVPFADLGTYAWYALLFVGLVFLVRLLQLVRMQGVSFPRAGMVLPLVYAVGYTGVLPAIPSIVIKLFVAIVVGIVLFAYMIRTPFSVEETLEDTSVLIAVILLTTTIASVHFYFAFSWWVFVFGGSLLFAVAFWHVLYNFQYRARLLGIALLTNMLLMAELLWTLLYWSVHYFTIAVVIFAIFYILYMLVKLESRNALRKHNLIFHFSISIILLFGALVSAPWIP